MSVAEAAFARRFTASYAEAVTLRDGRHATLRLARPDDAAGLQRGFALLSGEARYQRFFFAKSALSADELREALDCDGEERLALAATEARGEGVGLARFVRLRGSPASAEAAITVADGWRCCGLGAALLSRLLAAAAERGVRSLVLYVLGDNAAMLALARKVAPGTRLSPAPEIGPAVVEVVMPISSSASGAASPSA